MKQIFYTVVFCNISSLLASLSPIEKLNITKCPYSETYTLHCHNGDRMVFRPNNMYEAVVISNQSTRFTDSTPEDFNSIKQIYLSKQNNN